MNCPTCNEKMKEIEKCGITLDICPGCKGVWLDRGELEKLMEYAAATGGETAARRGDDRRDLNSGDRHEYRERYKKRDYDDDDDHDEDRYDRYQKEYSHGDDRYHGEEGQRGQYPRKKSWVSNIFDMFGD